MVEPVAETLNNVEFTPAPVVEPIANRVVFVSPLFACTESLENGLVEPTPTKPELFIVIS